MGAESVRGPVGGPADAWGGVRRARSAVARALARARIPLSGPGSRRPAPRTEVRGQPVRR